MRNIAHFATYFVLQIPFKSHKVLENDVNQGVISIVEFLAECGLFKVGKKLHL